jgi:hypothetical protein
MASLNCLVKFLNNVKTFKYEIKYQNLQRNQGGKKEKEKKGARKTAMPKK